MVTSICRAVMPLAYKPPTMAPMLVPAMQSMGIFRSSRTLRTPMCAMPRAPPPDSTRQIRGRIAGGVPAGAAIAGDAVGAAGAPGAAGAAAAQDAPIQGQAAHSAQAIPRRKLSFPIGKLV